RVKPGVFITVDVECSMGGAWADDTLRPVPPARAVMGACGDRQLGLPRICKILGEADLAATFFVEPFADEQGHPGEMERPCGFLAGHGHDVQLHVHPNHWHYGLKQQGRPFRRTDCFAECEPDEQRFLLDEGCDRLERWTGRRAVAFRAGNMAASEKSLEHLAAAGIRIDSSYTFPYAGGQCRFRPGEPYNGSRWYGEVLEVALSGFTQAPFPGLHRAKPLDVGGISFAEMRDAILRITEAGADACLILHSFSLFKVRDVQYNGGRPDRIVTRRFRRLCEWLAERRGAVPVYTFSDLARAVDEGTYEARSAPPPRLSLGRALVRKAVQAYDNLYWT
ncbi:MAG: polysaccharide deacetylase, partial [Phycisphaerae bacterium]